MLRIVVDDDLEMRPVEESDAEPLFALTEENRAYLREWLPWLDDTRRPEDTRAFVRSAMQQFAGENGFQLAILYKGELAGVVGLHFINRE
ncbi:MAG: GNAT family N-acetyltransferase, partial [Chloroflexia bacterium]